MNLHPTASAACPSGGHRYDILSVGELLIDLTQVDVTEHGVALYGRNPGGAPANLAAAAAKLGCSTAFVGCVGNDPQGVFALDALTSCGVDVGHSPRTDNACTTMAFATLGPSGGEFSYSFVRKPGADQLLEDADLPSDLLAQAKVLHVGSFSLTAEPSGSTVVDAVRRARELGLLVSCDVNYRPHAWSSEEAARRAMISLVAAADLVKVSQEEAHVLCGTPDAATAAAALLAQGPRLVAITRAENGAYLATRAGSASVAALAAREVRDTTGAGDSFWGACLAWLLKEGAVGGPADLDGLTASDLAACGAFACATASLTVERPGGMTSSPTRQEVEQRLAQA